MVFIGQWFIDGMIVLAGAGAFVVIAGAMWRRVVWVLQRGSRGVDEARELLGSVAPVQDIMFPVPPSVEYLPTVYGVASGIPPFRSMPSWESVSVEPVESHLFRLFRRDRDLVAKLVTGGGSVTVALVMRKIKLGSGGYENGSAQYGCDFVVAMDKENWKRPHPRADMVAEIVEVVFRSHWVYAGERRCLNWRRYEGEYVEYGDSKFISPNKVVRECGWVFTRDRSPMTMPYNQVQILSYRELWAGGVVYPYYLIVEKNDGEAKVSFQGIDRSIAFQVGRSERWGERLVLWEGPERGTFAEAVRDLFEHYGDLNCSPVYAQSGESVFKPLSAGEVLKGCGQKLFVHLRLGDGHPDRTVCGLLSETTSSCVGFKDMLKYERLYKRRRLGKTLERGEKPCCAVCLQKALKMEFDWLIERRLG